MKSNTMWRYNAATVILVVTIFMSALFTVWYSSVSTNSNVALLQSAFVLLLLPEIIQQWKSSSLIKNKEFLFYTALSLLSICGWYAQGINVFEINRTYIYIIQLLFIISAVLWFRKIGDAGLEIIFRAKLQVLLLSVLFIFIGLWKIGYPSMDWYHPVAGPINFYVFRNIRHLNYEIAIVLMLATTCWVQKKTKFNSEYWFLFIFLGCFSLWTVGRGQIVAFYAFIGIFLLLSPSRLLKIEAFKPLLGFTLGVTLFILVTPDYLSYMQDKSSSGTINNISSGRLDIWFKGIDLTITSWLSTIFGLGPEAYVRFRETPSFVHPHNAIVQLFMEFGLLGLTVLYMLIMKFIKNALNIVKSPTVIAIFSALAALSLYSLVDGIIYHASPLMLTSLFIAYILSKQEASLACLENQNKQPIKPLEN